MNIFKWWLVIFVLFSIGQIGLVVSHHIHYELGTILLAASQVSSCLFVAWDMKKTYKKKEA